MRETELTGWLSRSRPRLSAAAGVLSHLLDLLDVQHVRISLRQYARLRRYDLRLRHGAFSQTEGGISRRQLLLGALAALAHGRIRRDYWKGGISVSNTHPARIFSTPVLRRSRMRRHHRQAYPGVRPRRQHGLLNRLPASRREISPRHR